MSARILTVQEGQDLLLQDNEELPYRLVKNLGHGHSANVEMIEDIQSGAVFARKVFRVSHRRTEGKEIFENEIKIIRRLEPHHHVVRVYATYMAKREIGLILSPVADGGDLELFLQDCSGQSMLEEPKERILRSAFGCLASALCFMHQQKVRHKDIKPRNILIHQGAVLYTDFGYSLDYSLAARSTTTGRPTSFTRKYCAPEVQEWDPRNSKSDLFSLGCVFLELVAALDPAVVIPESEDSYHAMMQEIQECLRFTNYNHLGCIKMIILDMMKLEPSSRPTALQVTGRIRRLSRSFFCNDCMTTTPSQSGKTPEMCQTLKRKTSELQITEIFEQSRPKTPASRSESQNCTPTKKRRDDLNIINEDRKSLEEEIVMPDSDPSNPTTPPDKIYSAVEDNKSCCQACYPSPCRHLSFNRASDRLLLTPSPTPEHRRSRAAQAQQLGKVPPVHPIDLNNTTKNSESTTCPSDDRSEDYRRHSPRGHPSRRGFNIRHSPAEELLDEFPRPAEILDPPAISWLEALSPGYARSRYLSGLPIVQLEHDNHNVECGTREHYTDESSHLYTSWGNYEGIGQFYSRLPTRESLPPVPITRRDPK